MTRSKDASAVASVSSPMILSGYQSHAILYQIIVSPCDTGIVCDVYESAVRTTSRRQ